MTVAAAGAPVVRAASATRPFFALTVPRFLVLLAAHCVFGALVPADSLAITVAAWVLIAGAIAITWLRPEAGFYCAAYLIGFELLWRMTYANIWWEAGKYSAALVLLLSLRHRFKLTPITVGAIVYFALLLPSIAPTLGSLSPALARSRIAFNLSGPFLLAVSIIAISLIPLREIRPQRLLGFLTLGIGAVAARVGWLTLRAENIVFEAEASFATSGGYGPNQVSTVLGAGALAMVLLGSQASNRLHQALWYSFSGLLLFQSVLTFSRGGVGASLLGVLALVAHLTLTPRRAGAFLLGLLTLSSVLWFVVFPRADQWTGGLLADRFSSLDDTGRFAMAEQDMQMFLEHPFLGVGVGMAPLSRPISHFGVASHTEYSRMLSEHGTLGILSLGILTLIMGSSYLRAPTFGTKAWIAAFLVWGLGNMATSALRLALSAVLLGFAFIDFGQEGQHEQPDSS